MARFIPLDDSYALDIKRGPIPTNQCTLKRPRNSAGKGLYIATINDSSCKLDIIFRINPLDTPDLRERPLDEPRNIVINYREELCTPPKDMLQEKSNEDPPDKFLPVKGLFPYVVAIEVGIDPVYYLETIPIIDIPSRRRGSLD